MGKPELISPSPKTKKEEHEDEDLLRPIDHIDSRKTSELVVALCGAVGAGVSTVSKEINKRFASYSYNINIIKISEIISEISPIPKNISRFQRIDFLQQAGNSIREKFGFDYLAQLAIVKINHERFESRNKELSSEEITQQTDAEKINYSKDLRKPRRHVTIIDSLKHPQEVELLQKVYGKMFCLFGVLCNDQQRKDRLINEGQMSESEAVLLMDRDKKEKIKHGQQLLETLQHSDFFIRNSKRNTTSLEKPLKRFIGLLLGQNNITPTIDEFGMYMAESAARRSGCLSRQVGAAILTEFGDIVSTGRNDVPKAMGGLYCEEDDEFDDRCFRQFDRACSNQKNKELIFHRINKIFIDVLKDDCFHPLIKEAIDELKHESEIKDLLEYSRAVHAEMDAITAAARNGNYSLKGTTLYSTTFPCHHCARHIVASGIKTVYYIEPYEKSLATKLHPDSITLDSHGIGENETKVAFVHFEGVAPKRYLDLFSCNNRKEKGTLKEMDPRSQRPTFASQLDTFLEYEVKVIQYIEKQKSQKMGEPNES